MNEKPHHTPEGRARLSELGKAVFADPVRVAAMRGAKAAKSPWPARVPELRRMIEAGASGNEIARHFKCSPATIQYQCVQRGISATAIRDVRMQAGADVLRRIYGLPGSLAEKLAEYQAARGPVSVDAMRQHAQRLGLQAVRAKRVMPPKATGNLLALRAAERAALAPGIQARLDAGETWSHIMRVVGVSWKRLRTMVTDGLIAVPERVNAVEPKVAKPNAPLQPAVATLAPRIVALDPPRVTTQLPPPSGDGKIYATFWAIRAWAGERGFVYDGSNMDTVNKRRAGMGLALLVQSEEIAA